MNDVKMYLLIKLNYFDKLKEIVQLQTFSLFNYSLKHALRKFSLISLTLSFSEEYLRSLKKHENRPHQSSQTIKYHYKKF